MGGPRIHFAHHSFPTQIFTLFSVDWWGLVPNANLALVSKPEFSVVCFVRSHEDRRAFPRSFLYRACYEVGRSPLSHVCCPRACSITILLGADWVVVFALLIYPRWASFTAVLTPVPCEAGYTSAKHIANLLSREVSAECQTLKENTTKLKKLIEVKNRDVVWCCANIRNLPTNAKSNRN